MCVTCTRSARAPPYIEIDQHHFGRSYVRSRHINSTRARGLVPPILFAVRVIISGRRRSCRQGMGLGSGGGRGVHKGCVAPASYTRYPVQRLWCDWLLLPEAICLFRPVFQFPMSSAQGSSLHVPAPLQVIQLPQRQFYNFPH